MKITYDHEVDALYIRFTDTTVTTKYLEDGIALDYDASNHLAGIEILDAARRVHNSETLKQVVFEKAPSREIKNQVAAGSQSPRSAHY
ncbi:MAG: DUF2283 domain-containing protein [Caldilineaceae bacterium SB0661_bin_32]|uniref:DUF2283 domain-containing protein n=1 Tax=Caldilineaceae bacterium SB0661_bin_32 TaxID=2605255 RepID=A0A6B1D934_9CHLR|nr:DUF2283 domain-containing protein [Caldilineaceae bacterium SB0661_bin_32]